MSSTVFRCAAACLLSLALAGCSLSSTSAPSPDPGLALTGAVHGGQQPIAGAHVYLFAANTTGYGNASVSLLAGTPDTSLDSSGGPTNGDYYVTSGAGGSFSIAATDYGCTPNTQVYLYALGGNPGLAAGTDNTAAGLLAALGNCPSTGNFLTATPYVVVNEVSTIAAAYALAGFATDAVHVSSSGTALAPTGIANAFANATNLETISTGVALATTPAGNGTVPQTTIDTLANILAACVNSTGAITGPTNPSACYTLFNNAESAATAGTLPTDTATAAIDIAHNPGTNITALYGLASATPPFAPALTAQPNDLTIALQYTGGGVKQPNGIAIDGSGNAWVVNHGSTFSVSEFSSLGTAISGAGGFTAGGLEHPQSITIDAAGNAWIANWIGPESGAITGESIVVLSSGGSLVSGSPYSTGVNYPSGIAIDGTGNAWVESGSFVVELSSSGSILSGANGFSGDGLSGSDFTNQSIAIDGSGSVWTPNLIGSSVTKLSSSGAPIADYTGGNLNGPDAIAIDGSGSAWILNNGNAGLFVTYISSVPHSSPSGLILSVAGDPAPTGISIDGSGHAWISSYDNSSILELSNAGSVLSAPPYGYAYQAGTGALQEPNAIAVDGSGDVWTANYLNNSVAEVIGLATPVITPICAGLPSTPTANGSSNLGTRP